MSEEITVRIDSGVALITPDPIKFGPRSPRLDQENPFTVPIAFVEIPEPTPDLATAIVDAASGLMEDGTDRGIVLQYNGENSNVLVMRETSSTDLAGTQVSVFNNSTNQEQANSKRIGLVKIIEDAASNWIPIISRGIFYKVWQMNSEEGENSWLRSAGFTNGQYLLLGYCTELDWRQVNQGDNWTGTDISGGGGIWNSLQKVTVDSNAQSLSVLPLGPSEDTEILAVGGIKTSNGVELLTEAPIYYGDVLKPPGAAISGLIGYVLCEVYAAPWGGITTGRQKSSINIGQGYEIGLGSVTKTASTLITSYAPTAVVNQSIIRFSGAFLIQTEGYYTFELTHQGKITFFHWNLPVIDKGYGNTISATRENFYTAYLHAGWHNFAIEWSPDTGSDTFELTFGACPNSVIFSPDPTTRSKVQTIDTNGEILLTQGYVALQSNNPPSVYASFAAINNFLPYRGYYNDNGGFVGLDLNPAYGRSYNSDTNGTDNAELSTLSWATTNSCWIYCIPSLACGLTDAEGTPYSTGSRNWYSAAAYGKYGTIRWSPVSNSVLSGVSIDNAFGSSSSFGTANFGSAVFTSTGQPSNEGVELNTDPRGDYNSGQVIGHIDVVTALPNISALLEYDVRSRGGGLSHNINPNQLPAGSSQDLANTFWDLSPIDGYESAIDGIAVVQVPKSILNGEDGGPIFTTQEVEDLVSKTLAAGIKPAIIYV